MRLSFELARRGYRRYAAYPGATVAGLFTNVVFGFLIAYILLAVYDETRLDRRLRRRGRDRLRLDLAGAAVRRRHLRPGWCELARRVQTGDVATDLQRPLDVQRAAFAQDVGTRAVPAALARPCRSSCSARFSSRSRSRTSSPAGSLFAVSVALAVAVELRRPLPGQPLLVLAARLPRRRCSSRSRVNLVLSGAVIPLAFFPEPLDTVAAADAVRRDACRRRSTSTSASRSAGASRSCWRCRPLGRSRCYSAGQHVLAAGTRKLVLQGG